jgi:hypothetical protein
VSDKHDIDATERLSRVFNDLISRLQPIRRHERMADETEVRAAHESTVVRPALRLVWSRD